MYKYVYIFIFVGQKGSVKGDEGTKSGKKKKSKINVGKDMSTDETDNDFDKHGKEEITINHHEQHSLKSLTKTIHWNRIKTNYKCKEEIGNLLL